MTPFRILAVCTGNISRSPAVERLLAAALGSGFAVSSAGTYAVQGAAVDPKMAPYVEAAGGSVVGFAARQLSGALVREADLVLALTRDHRSRVLELEPAALRRTFTLLEFARIVGLVDEVGLPSAPLERLRALVAQAPALRPVARASSPAEDDVPDPWGRDQAAYDLAFALISGAVGAIVTATVATSSRA